MKGNTRNAHSDSLGGRYTTFIFVVNRSLRQSGNLVLHFEAKDTPSPIVLLPFHLSLFKALDYFLKI